MDPELLLMDTPTLKPIKPAMRPVPMVTLHLAPQEQQGQWVPVLTAEQQQQVCRWGPMEHWFLWFPIQEPSVGQSICPRAMPLQEREWPKTAT